jgi:hypothetical protein
VSEHLLSPAADETLSDFIRRAMRERGLKVPGLVQRARALDGNRPEETVERLVKRLRSGATASITPATAELLGPALEADFSPFLRDYASSGAGRVTSARFAEAVDRLDDLLQDVLERLDALERRQASD